MTEGVSHSTKHENNQPHLKKYRTWVSWVICVTAREWRKPARQPDCIMPNTYVH